MAHRNSSPDIFAVLPAPVLEMILLVLEDLPSLHNLYCASLTIRSLLHEDGVGPPIIEAIMAHSVPSETRILIRKIAFLRWNTSPVFSVDAFIEQYIVNGHIGQHLPRKYISNGATYDHLPRNMPASVICYILSLAATVRFLAHAGIHEMINRCMELELYRLQDPKSKWNRILWWNIRLGRPMGDYFPVPTPDRERYQQVNVGPPSWAELQRANRALWQLLLVWELHGAVCGQEPRWKWPPVEVHRLKDLHIDEIWQHSLWNRDLEQIRTMENCDSLFPSLASPAEKYHSVLYAARNAQWQCPCDCPPTPSVINEKDLFGSAPGYEFVIGDLSSFYKSPLRYVEFRVFRRFGFAIWDQRRMDALGLFSTQSTDEQLPHSPKTEPDIFCRWQSILNTDEREEIERRRKHFWPGRDQINMESVVRMKPKHIEHWT